jgi:hypothetical protein
MLGVGVQNSTQLGRRTEFLGPFIWGRASGLIQATEGNTEECQVMGIFIHLLNVTIVC